MTDIQTMKTDHFYVVDLDGRRTIVKAVIDKHRTKVYECGDEQGWELPRDEIDLVIIREIRI